MKQKLLKNLPIFFVAALCMILTSCGGGDDPTPGPTPGPTPVNNPENPIEQNGIPLTLEAISNGTITFKNRAAGPVSYRIDNGNVQTIAAGTDGHIPVSAGQKVTLFGDNATYNPGDETSNISSTADFYAYGNIMSLISSNGYNAATTLTEIYAFSSLFEEATHLKSHPDIPLLLPATNISEGCYDRMFYGCTSMTTAPVLPAKKLADYCYDYMFYGCSSLNYVKCLAEDFENFINTDEWLEGVAPSGTFVKAPGISWNKGSSSCIPSGWTVVDNAEEPNNDPGEEGVEPVYSDINSTPLTLEPIADGSITFTNKAAGNVIYRVGGYAPQTIAPNTSKTIYVTAGQKVRFFGDNSAYYRDVFSYSNISSTADFYAYGNIMSLVNSQNYANTIKLTKEYTFAELFENSIHLRSHPNLQLVLPATTLTSYCYFRMFKGCSSLTTPSVLPANKLAKSCYHFMYANCKNLNKAPILSATILAEDCYYGMFGDCSSLTIAPDLPATTLASSCYNGMFNGCTSLTSAPELPATTLEYACYFQMFCRCISLITPPVLPAKTLTKECYAYMFRDCESLTTAPELPATTLAVKCYYHMFDGCTSLNYVKCIATNKSATDCTSDWLNGTSSNGTFVKKSGVSWTSGISGIPSGWTVQEE